MRGYAPSLEHTNQLAQRRQTIVRAAREQITRIAAKHPSRLSLAGGSKSVRSWVISPSRPRVPDSRPDDIVMLRWQEETRGGIKGECPSKCRKFAPVAKSQRFCGREYVEFSGLCRVRHLRRNACVASPFSRMWRRLGRYPSKLGEAAWRVPHSPTPSSHSRLLARRGLPFSCSCSRGKAPQVPAEPGCWSRNDRRPVHRLPWGAADRPAILGSSTPSSCRRRRFPGAPNVDRHLPERARQGPSTAAMPVPRYGLRRERSRPSPGGGSAVAPAPPRARPRTPLDERRTWSRTFDLIRSGRISPRKTGSSCRFRNARPYGSWWCFPWGWSPSALERLIGVFATRKTGPHFQPIPRHHRRR